MVQIRQGAKISKIEAEDNGVEVTGVDGGEEVERLVGIQVDDQEDQVDEVVAEDLPNLIHWRVNSAGCVAIWPVTVPTPVHNRTH